MFSTHIVTTLGDYRSLPVLQFLQFIAKSNAAFPPNGTTLIKIFRRRLGDYVSKNLLDRFG